MTKQIERAIDLCEEYCCSSFDEARDELGAVREKVRSYDMLWERARVVVVTFESLGRTNPIGTQLEIQRRCEAALVGLKEILDLGGLYEN